jgi:LPS-assembly lipoprotein
MSSSELPRQRRRALLAAGMAVVLPGCGFELRRLPELPFQRIMLAGFAPRSPLAEDLERALAERVTVTRDLASAQVVLQAMVDARERSVVAQTAAAQVRELQLRLKFQFRAHTPAGRELVPPALLLLARDMSYNENIALAKEQEEGELYRDMQADVVLQVMRRLAAIRL